MWPMHSNVNNLIFYECRTGKQLLKWKEYQLLYWNKLYKHTKIISINRIISIAKNVFANTKVALRNDDMKALKAVCRWDDFRQGNRFLSHRRTIWQNFNWMLERISGVMKTVIFYEKRIFGGDVFENQNQ